MSTDTIQLLELLREAGDEAVTLDELAVVGVRDPARTLRALEEAGHAIQRVRERPGRGHAVTCVRLAAPAPAVVRPPVRVAPRSAARPHPDGRLLGGAAAGGLLALALARALSRRTR
jgi:hypothetical protein